MSQTTAIQALGRAIRARREALGLTQPEYAARAGLDPDYIPRVERGDDDPGYDVLLKLAAGLDTPVSTLFADAEDEESAVRPPGH
jgi:transcriptional regulator with XRE-family HTH domain